MATSTQSDLTAVIVTGGKQYLVSEGDEIAVEKLGDQKTLTVTPLAVTKAGALVPAKSPKVTATVLGPVKGPKLVVFKMRPKKQSRVKTGHRQQLSQVRIDKISA
jgi:large subunit ribosomal protein L21